MTTPCEQEDVIKETRVKVDDIGRNIGRLCESNEKLAAEMREMNQTLVSHMISNKEYSVRIAKFEKDNDILFTRIRRFEDDEIPAMKQRLGGVESCCAYLKTIPTQVKDLEAWQNRMRGALIVFPGACTAISTIAAVIAVYISLSKG